MVANRHFFNSYLQHSPTFEKLFGRLGGKLVGGDG